MRAEQVLVALQLLVETEAVAVGEQVRGQAHDGRSGRLQVGGELEEPSRSGCPLGPLRAASEASRSKARVGGVPYARSGLAGRPSSGRVGWTTAISASAHSRSWADAEDPLDRATVSGWSIRPRPHSALSATSPRSNEHHLGAATQSESLRQAAPEPQALTGVRGHLA